MCLVDDVKIQRNGSCYSAAEVDIYVGLWGKNSVSPKSDYIRELLKPDCPDSGHFRLQRVSTHDHGIVDEDGNPLQGTPRIACSARARAVVDLSLELAKAFCAAKYRVNIG